MGAKRRYIMTDLKALAVVQAVKAFKLYIKGKHLKVVSDQNELEAYVNKIC